MSKVNPIKHSCQNCHDSDQALEMLVVLLTQLWQRLRWFWPLSDSIPCEVGRQDKKVTVLKFFCFVIGWAKRSLFFLSWLHISYGMFLPVYFPLQLCNRLDFLFSKYLATAALGWYLLHAGCWARYLCFHFCWSRMKMEVTWWDGEKGWIVN